MIFLIIVVLVFCMRVFASAADRSGQEWGEQRPFTKDLKRSAGEEAVVWGCGPAILIAFFVIAGLIGMLVMG
ncbi:hypothetical protein [Kineococcus terrestris]|uniref:hypothetical protein n=1 Tax=Kineococcus terrestris TaxID=2044856 RepID=UPI0034DB4E39